MPGRRGSSKDRQNSSRAESPNNGATAHHKPLSNPQTSHRTNHPRRIVRCDAAVTAVERASRWTLRSFYPGAPPFGVAESSRSITGFRQWSALDFAKTDCAWPADHKSLEPYPAKSGILSIFQKDKAIEDAPGTEEVSDTDRRLLRGGSFISLPSLVRSAYRTAGLPDLPAPR